MRNIPPALVGFAFAVFGVAAQAVPLKPHVSLQPQHSSVLTRVEARPEGLDDPSLGVGQQPNPILVLLVEFPDESHADNWTLEAVEEAYFGADGSLRDYYVRASYGRYEPGGAVHPWIRLSRTQEFYTDGRGGISAAPRNAPTMVADLVRAADPQVDFSRFDNDGPDGIPSSGDDDGRVDALVVVHAGTTLEETGSRDRFLSHWWQTPGAVATDDGVVVFEYALVGESSPLGVRAHEFAHHLGLPDLYDRNAVFANASGGLGNWSLMAAGVWLGDGDNPADLDAPSKIQVAFVDPIVPVRNQDALPLRARSGNQPPDVYQVWTHGRVGHESLVIVNRRRTDLDTALPGGGMLVYHANLAQAGNDDRDDLRVQLLQADGRADLESFRNNGDAGDPWPRGDVVPCCELDAHTNPSTRARDGSDSQIVISNISNPTSVMQFDLVLESEPFIRVADHALYEMQGDGDGIPEVGELLQLDVDLANEGVASSPANVFWRTEPPTDAEWIVDTAPVSALEADSSTEVTLVLRAASAPTNPKALHLVGVLSENNGTRHVLERIVALGGDVGFLACFDAVASSTTRDCDDPVGPWSVDVLRGDAGWSLERTASDLGGVYRSARGPRYPNGVDVALVTPAFNVEAGQEVHVLHEYDVEEYGAGWANDGGRVEISLHGEDWETLVPQRGYPQKLFPVAVPHLAAAGVFSGASARRWDVFPVGLRSGSARLRFRFVSNDSIGDSGWQIARLEVRQPPADPTPEVRLHVVAEPNPARMPTRIAFRVTASRSLVAQSTRLLVYDVRGRLIRELVHAPVPAQAARFIWDGMDHAGRAVSSGVYWTRLEWGRETATAKLVVIR